MDQQNNRMDNLNSDFTYDKIDKKLKSYHNISILAIVASILSIIYWSYNIHKEGSAYFAEYEQLSGIINYALLITINLPQIIKLVSGILGTKVRKNPLLVRPSLILLLIYFILTILMFFVLVSRNPDVLKDPITRLYAITGLMYISAVVAGFEIIKWIREKDAAAERLRSMITEETDGISYEEIKTSLKWYHIISIIALVMSIIVLLILPIFAFAIGFYIKTNYAQLADRGDFYTRIVLLLLGGPEIIKLIAAIRGLRVRRNPASVTLSWILYIVYVVIMLVLNYLGFVRGAEFVRTFDAETCIRVTMLLIYLFEIYLGFKIRKWVKAEKSRERMPEVQIPAVQMPDVQIPARQMSDAQFPAEQIPAQQIPDAQFPAEQIPAQQIPDTQIPAQQVPDMQIPDVKMPDVQMPVLQTPDMQIPDLKIPDVHMPAQQIPDVQTTAEQIPAQQIPDVQTPAEQPSGDQTPRE